MKQNKDKQYSDFEEEYERTYEHRRKSRDKKPRRTERDYDHIEENEEE